jgi:hypothetical protein
MPLKKVYVLADDENNIVTDDMGIPRIWIHESIAEEDAGELSRKLGKKLHVVAMPEEKVRWMRPVPEERRIVL